MDAMEFSSNAYESIVPPKHPPSSIQLSPGVFSELHWLTGNTQITGKFPARRKDIPDTVLHYFNDQLKTRLNDLDDYEWHGRTGRRHRLEILSYLQVRKVSKADKEKAVRWLVTEVFPHSGEKDNLHIQTHDWFHVRRVICPSGKEIDRIVARACTEFEAQLFRSIYESLTTNTRKKLEELLTDTVELGFSDLKSDPGRLSLGSILVESKRGPVEEPPKVTNLTI